MTSYKVKITPDAKADLKRYRDYLLYRKKSPQAARSVVQDFYDTASKLKDIAGSLAEPESPALKERKLKRINFIKHDYFLLYRIEGTMVFVTDMFHSLEDFERKLV